MAISIVVVARNLSMYKKFFVENTEVNGCNLVCYDNTQENLPLPIRYNDWIEKCPHNDWIIFCHEDFLINKLPDFSIMDPTMLYGVIGVSSRFYTNSRNHYPFIMGLKMAYLGQIVVCNKDGSERCDHGSPVDYATEVDLVDCCCVMAHRSLLLQTGLRFDPCLPFDLYAEDLCMQYSKLTKRRVQVMPFACEHWSRGTLTPSYYRGVSHLAEKFPQACFINTCGSLLGGGAYRIHPLIVKQFDTLERWRSSPMATLILGTLHFLRKIYYWIVRKSK